MSNVLPSSRKVLSLVAVLVASIVAAPTSSAQNAKMIGSEFIPPDGLATVVVNPAALMTSPATELYPTEIAEAWALDNIGVSPKDCESIKLVVAVPGPLGPMAAAVFTMNKDVAITDLNPLIIGDGQMVDIGGHQCIPIPGPPGVVLHQLDSKTIILASSNYLDSVISVSKGSDDGILAGLAARAPHPGQLTALVAVEPVRPMIQGAVQMFANQLPPQLFEFTKIPEMLDAILVRVNVEDSEKGLNLTLLAVDDGAADQMQTMITDSLNMVRNMALAEIMSNVGPDDPLQEATIAYAQRMGDQIIEQLTPERTGRRLSLSASAGGGLATQGVLVAMLLPAVSQARFAAERASSQNNLKQIGLAMHNHHSAYKELPDAIRDEDGKALLSWRVKILPFIEEQALYQQFHLDEPWDSEHNIKLLPQMPRVYAHPGFDLAPGKTIYHVPAGEGMMFKTDGSTRFRDVLDGLSNTIMAFEANAEHAVDWTKPEDATIDMDNPVDAMNQEGVTFGVLMGDGSVHQLAHVIDLDVLKALLTRNGREVIDNF